MGCYDIPEANRKYTPSCAGAGNRVPEWCYSIPVSERYSNPVCAGAGSEAIPPWTQDAVCHSIPTFVMPIVGPVLGCNGGDGASGIRLPFPLARTNVSTVGSVVYPIWQFLSLCALL